MASQKEINELLKQALGYEKEAKRILAEKTQELVKQKNISEAEAKIQARKDESFKAQLELVKEIRFQLKEAKDEAQETIGALMQQEKSLKGLSGLQASLVNHERRKIDILASGKRMSDNTRNTIESISSLNQELLQTSAEDVVTRGEIERQINEQLKGLKNLGVAGTELKQIMEEEFEIAKGISSMNEQQQKILNKQLEVYEGIKDTIGGIFATASIVTSGVAGFLGMATMAAGHLVDALGNVNKELGITLGQTSSITAGTSAIGLLGIDSAGGLKQLTDEFGNMNDIAFSTQLNMGLMSLYAGTSNQELATLTGAFARLNGGSQEVALNLIESTRQMAYMKGVAPAAVLQDMAAATEDMAIFSKGTGQNLMEAAIQARQLGLSMNKVSGVASGLLDFESSITKELELSAMLGKSINLNRARGLAYMGKTAEATEEALKQLGGYNDFLKMDPIMRKQAADLLNLSVADLEKAAKNQSNLNKEGFSFNETLNSWNAGINAFASTGLGSALKAVGGLILAMGQAVIQAKLMSAAMNGQSTGGMLSSLNPFKRSGGAVTGGGAPFMAAQNPPPQLGPVNQVGSSINATSLLKGAGAMLIMAGALFVFAKAAQEFSEDIQWSNVFIGIGAMASLGAVAAILGAGPIAAAAGIGTLIILGLASAFYVFAAASNIMSEAIGKISSFLPALASGLTPLIGMVGGIALLGASFAALGIGLATLGSMGTISIPVLLALGAVGGGIAALATSFGGSDEESESSLGLYHKDMLDHMETLITAVNNIDTNVYINGRLVTDNVTKGQQSDYKNLAGRGVVFGGTT